VKMAVSSKYVARRWERLLEYLIEREK
jgi:hypothetical protein